MAKLIWAVFCERAIQDVTSKLLSMIDVVEGLKIAVQESAISEANEPPERILGGPITLSLVIWWDRSDRATKEKVDARLVTFAPDGTRVRDQGFFVDLEQSARRRTILKFDAFPIGFGSGTYRFKVQMKVGKEKWRTVAELPLDLSFTPEPAPSST